MKIYVSGSYSERDRLQKEAHKLFELGHEITGSWLHEVAQPDHLSLEEWYHALAIKDVAEVSSSDCIILDLNGISTTGGRYVEWGIAIDRYNMLKFVVGGDQSGVFTTLADHKFSEWSEMVTFIKEHHNAP